MPASLESLTPPARAAVERLAEMDAHLFNHAEIDPEHILLGLLRSEDQLAPRIIQLCNADARSFRDRVRNYLQPAPDHVWGRLPLSVTSLGLLNIAQALATEMGHASVNSGHILMSMVGNEHASLCRLIVGALKVPLPELRELLVRETRAVVDDGELC